LASVTQLTFEVHVPVPRVIVYVVVPPLEHGPLDVYTGERELFVVLVTVNVPW